MKKCQNCKREYADETLNFCLDDGTVLVSYSNATTDENIARPTEHKTEILTHEQVTKAYENNPKTESHNAEQLTAIQSQSNSSQTSEPQIIKQGVSPIFAYLSVGLLLLLVLIAGVGVFAWINYSSNSNTELVASNSNSNETNSVNEETDSTQNQAVKEDSTPEKKTPKPTPQKVLEDKKETPKPTTKPKPSATTTASPTATPSATPTPKPDTGKFFVILGSFPKSQSIKAKKRLQQARSKGLNARIVNTNNHPALRNGLIAVVMGPFSKSAAKGALSRAKSVSSDAYIKGK